MFQVLQHEIPKSLVLLAIAETTVLIASVFFGIKFYLMLTPEVQEPSYILTIAALYSLVIFFSLLATGWRWHDAEENAVGRLLRLGFGFLIGSAVFFASASLLVSFPFGKNFFLVMTGVGFISILAVHCAYELIANQGFLVRRIMVLGAGERASQLAQSTWPNIKVVGYVPYAERQVKIADDKLLVSDLSLREIAKKNDVREIVVALDERRKNFPFQELLECKMAGLKIVELVRFFESHSGKIKVNDLVPSNIIFSQGFRKAKFEGLGKRFFDVGVSLILLFATLPVMLLTALMIFLESNCREPVFYRQTRVGKDNVEFQILKFRTMRTDAEQEGIARWADKNDSRVTKIGKMLRKFRIDELPQLINVLKAEMSFVGPRPERPEFIKLLEKDIPYYTLRHTVKPGITGWAQISYPYGSSAEDAKEKLQYDLYYIKNYSILFDLYILLQTVHTVMWGRGGR